MQHIIRKILHRWLKRNEADIPVERRMQHYLDTGQQDVLMLTIYNYLP